MNDTEAEVVEVPSSDMTWPWLALCAVLISVGIWFLASQVDSDNDGESFSGVGDALSTLGSSDDPAGPADEVSQTAEAANGDLPSPDSSQREAGETTTVTEPDVGTEQVSGSSPASTLASNSNINGLAAEYLTGTGEGSAVLIDRSGERVIDGDLLITVTDQDFVMESPLSLCSKVAWSFTSGDLAVDYNSGDDCFTEHIMSPRSEVTLRPGVVYDVVVTFSGEAGIEVFVLEVTTAG